MIALQWLRYNDCITMIASQWLHYNACTTMIGLQRMHHKDCITMNALQWYITNLFGVTRWSNMDSYSYSYNIYAILWSFPKHSLLYRGPGGSEKRVPWVFSSGREKTPKHFVQGFILLFAFWDQNSAHYAKIFRVPESLPSFCARIYTIFCIRQIPKIIKISKS